MKEKPLKAIVVGRWLSFWGVFWPIFKFELLVSREGNPAINLTLDLQETWVMFNGKIVDLRGNFFPGRICMVETGGGLWD